MPRPPKRLDRKATILANEIGKDAAGGFTNAFKQVGPVRYCHREDRDGSEARSADANRSETSAIFTFGWFAGLTTDQRLECDGVLYDIVSPPRELGRRQFLLVSAKERPAQA